MGRAIKSKNPQKDRRKRYNKMQKNPIGYKQAERLAREMWWNQDRGVKVSPKFDEKRNKQTKFQYSSSGVHFMDEVHAEVKDGIGIISGFEP